MGLTGSESQKQNTQWPGQAQNSIQSFISRPPAVNVLHPK
jgi:hypothetical protein